MYWEQTPTGTRCLKPGHVDERGNPIEFSRGRVCPKCVSEPAEDRAREFVDARARRLAIKAVQLQERSDAWNGIAEKAVGEGELGHAAKLGTLSLQYDRFAEELLGEADGIEHDAELLRHDRELAGLRGSH